MAAIKALVVDDEAHVRDIMSRYLGALGYEVRQAVDVPNARTELATCSPSLVFLDINMPGPSGLELLEELAPRWPETAVIMSTAVGDIQTAMDAIRRGAADFIQKPVTLETVRFVAGRTLERRELLIQNRKYQRDLEKLVQKRTEELHRRNVQLLRTQNALVRGLCRLTEFRDPDTGEHLDRMARYTQIIAMRIAWSHPELGSSFDENMRQAAPLHDIGKVGIPDAILLKPGNLTASEFSIIKRHTSIGADTLTVIKSRLEKDCAPYLNVGIEICLSHHERWDGKGYPYGRKGTEIPLSARIVAVADYFDACTSPRIYRHRPINANDVIENIRENSEKAFDPEVVEAFLAEREVICQIQEAQIPNHTPFPRF
jgi:putative two-component system response regulator